MEKVVADMTGPISTPHWGSQSRPAFTVTATVTINAKPQPALDALLDTSTWPQWNKFVPYADLLDVPNDSSAPQRLKPNIMFVEHVDMAGKGRPTFVKMKLLMTSLDEINDSGRSGFKAVWLGKGYPDWALRTERVHELYQTAEGEGTIYHVYETFSGPLAFLVKLFVGQTLVKRFQQWNTELRDFVEKGFSAA